MTAASRSRTLPPEVYLRRRSLAVGIGAVILVLIIAAGVILLRSGGSKPPARSAVPAVAQGAKSTQSTSSSPSTAAPETSSTPSPTIAQAGQDCSDDWLSVVVAADKATYKTGEQPKFTGVLTNGAPIACRRDVGEGVQSFTVYPLNDSNRVWSSQDCAPPTGVNSQLLKPGQQVAFSASWTGKTSSAGCDADQRVDVAPGYYRVVAQLGNKLSAPVTFNIVGEQQ